MSDLDEFLARKRAALTAFKDAFMADPQPVEFSASVEVRGRSGVRVIRIRQFELINDTGPATAGFDLGPKSPEHLLAALGGCIAHSAEMIAAMMCLSVDEIGVEVSALAHPLGQTPGFESFPITPYNLKYTLTISSSEPAERIEDLHREIEATCPVLNLLKTPQPIAGRLEHFASCPDIAA
ncbi:MAG: OsmC family protein [Novosphingobium sp.]|nr:OsmC family protein [Novosphingobium sp.]